MADSPASGCPSAHSKPGWRKASSPSTTGFGDSAANLMLRNPASIGASKRHAATALISIGYRSRTFVDRHFMRAAGQLGNLNATSSWLRITLIAKAAVTLILSCGMYKSFKLSHLPLQPERRQRTGTMFDAEVDVDPVVWNFGNQVTHSVYVSDTRSYPLIRTVAIDHSPDIIWI